MLNKKVYRFYTTYLVLISYFAIGNKKQPNK